MSKEELNWKERRDIAQKTMDKREFDGYQREDGIYEGFGYISPFSYFSYVIIINNN